MTSPSWPFSWPSPDSWGPAALSDLPDGTDIDEAAALLPWTARTIYSIHTPVAFGQVEQVEGRPGLVADRDPGEDPVAPVAAPLYVARGGHGCGGAGHRRTGGRNMTRTVGLFDAEPDIKAVRDMRVGPVTEYDVHRLCEDHHYTKTGGNISWRYGLWSGFSLLGAVAYNLPTRSVCTSVFGEVGTHHVWHMGRLICIDDAPRNSESR